MVGRTVSHAHNVGPRRFEPNLQTVRAIVNGATRLFVPASEIGSTHDLQKLFLG